MDDFEKMKKALKDGEFVALEKGKDGNIIFGGSFKNDNNAVLSYSADNPEDWECVAEVIFITEKIIHPSRQL